MESSDTEKFVKSEFDDSYQDISDVILSKGIKQETLFEDIKKLTDGIKGESTPLCNGILSTQSLVKTEEEESINQSVGIYDIDFEDFKIKYEELDIKEENYSKSTETSTISRKKEEELFKVHKYPQKNQEKRRNAKLNTNGKQRNYQPGRKNSLKTHSRLKNLGDAIFKCDQCDYQTIYNKNLKIHILRCRNPGEVNKFKFGLCDFQTIHENSLKKHFIRHANQEKANIFQCYQCSYQTTEKWNLKRHVLRHSNPEEVNMFKCYQCSYQSIEKGHLKRHILRHNSPEKVNIFKCDQCLYQTFQKSHLRRHFIRHKNTKKVNLYECDQCMYQTNYKSHLKTHLLVHRMGS